MSRISFAASAAAFFAGIVVGMVADRTIPRIDERAPALPASSDERDADPGDPGARQRVIVSRIDGNRLTVMLPLPPGSAAKASVTLIVADDTVLPDIRVNDLVEIEIRGGGPLVEGAVLSSVTMVLSPE